MHVNLGLQFQILKFGFIDISVYIKPVKEAAHIRCGVHLVQRASIE